MTILEAIKQRHSVRSYTERPIEDEKMQQLVRLVNECNDESGLHIQLVTNDPKAFDTRMAHYGKFSGISNYFAMIGKKDDDLDEKIGYYGEKIVIAAQMLGLNTCWVGLTFKKNPDVLQFGEGEKLRAVIAVGYGTTKGVTHKVKPIEKVTKVNGTMPDWFRSGVEAALLAPTALNQQKFRFTLTDDGNVLLTSSWGFFTKIDLGIVKYHFEVVSGKSVARGA